MGLTHSKGPSPAKKVKKYAQKPPGKKWEDLTRVAVLSPSGIMPRDGLD